MRIRTQFIITMLLFGIILLVIAASAIITSRRVEKAEDQERIASSIAQGASELSYLANDYLIYREGQQLKRWQSRFGSFSAEVAGLQADRPEQKALAANIQANQRRLREVFESTVSAVGNRPANRVADLDPAFLQVSWSRMAVQSQVLISDASRFSQLCHQEIDRLREITSRLMYLMMGLFGALLLASYLLTYRRILKSIATLQSGTAVIGSGRLDFTIEEGGDDEIGALSHAFNRMTADLKAVTACKADLEKEVTDRKQAEERLRESEQRWATTLASVGDAVIATDVEGRVTFLNAVAESLTGWTLREAAQRPVREIFHIVNEHTRKEADDPVTKVLLEGNIVGLVNHTVLIRKDGTEVAIDDSGAPIKDASGDLLGVILVFRDITERRKAEQALRRLAQFPEENPSPVLRLAAGGALLYANAPARNWLATFGDQADGSLPDAVRAVVEHASLQEQVITTEVSNPDGNTSWICAVKPPGENYINLYCTDITERRRAEEALQESEHRVRAKLDAILSPEGDIGTLDLADLIDSAAIQTLMETFYTLAGIPMSILDLRGKVLVGVGWQTICTKFHRAHPETCAHCVESDTQLSAGLAQGEVRLYKCKNHMWDIATPIFIGGRHVGNVLSGQFLFEGESIDYERFRDQARRYGFNEPEYIAALEAVPRLSREAVDTGMAFFTKLTQMLSQLSYSNILLARLLSERDRLADSLRKSEQRLHRAQEIAHLGSWELDLTAKELTWSDEVYRIFGLEPQEFGATYEAFLERVHPDDRAAVDAAYTGSLRENRDTYEIEHRVVRKPNGQIRFVHEKCEHFRDASGSIIRSVGMVHDITERKEAEEELQKANFQLQEHARKLQETNKELESFAYTISHDLRGPLRAINGFARMLADDYGPSLEEEGKRRLGVIETNAVKMGLLIDDLLAFSRAGRIALNITGIDMNGLVFEVLEALKTSHGSVPQAEIRVPSLPAARGDRTLIRQVLSNLLENAMKFSRKSPQPKIEVGSFQRDGEHVYFVKDNGVGFDMKYYGKLFGVFQRLVTDKEFEGTGVGLAIVQRLVTRHEGRVWAEAKPGEGATFFFTLKQGGVAEESGSCMLT